VASIAGWYAGDLIRRMLGSSDDLGAGFGYLDAQIVHGFVDRAARTLGLMAWR
jgi:hypothetical protein